MVNYITSVALLLSLATSTLAVPQGLEARAPSCMDDLPANTLANINEAVECINYLASLGNQPCTAGVGAQSFCRRGNTQITGIAVGLPSDRTATSPCQAVARGAGLVMDRCSRGDGKVRGQNPAWGNGNLMVDIRTVPQ
ncbi:hypothetical protein NW754_010640 [Fusarium falciforme]|uniref:Hydrophobin n=1 Tax=Fusarium falciforme TaxID=195108 RepID=A0A9W8QXE6_9HYPO|nr:Hypothetical protein NCS54_00953800 [Fusarium falciforme]KAJ4168712.1 hypothetical protein NW754_010640 [Fusarium falciforme]KAJ4181637.1 hypothetical protein NW755_010906 [Fusarium falciforme]KAJ4193122.1 hypothetical protein NW767_010411 [Fusarium falciforme]KAJ4255230.1 hypothetical protein NW757_004743 [Fusarium falciforme]WAO92046.1 Hypothetical protein NCS54_00953800 [Fusarium falciforme]